MVAIFSLLTTLAISLLVTRIAAVALRLTGLSDEVAKFQARSAFTGTGFSSRETESIVNHPVRRRIAMTLMLMGNLGIAAVIASTIASFSGTGSQDNWTWPLRLVALAVGLVLLGLVGTSRWLDSHVSRWIEWALVRWTRVDVKDYVSLLHLSDGYVVLELKVKDADWITDKTLAESRLSREGILVLGIHRDSGLYIGSPNGEVMIRSGDVLSVYGPIKRLEELDLRKKGYEGDRAHRIAIADHKDASKEPVQQTPDTESPLAKKQPVTQENPGS